MKTIKIKNSWEDITIKDFEDIEAIQKTSDDYVDKYIKIIAVLSGLNEKDVLDINWNFLRSLEDQISFLSDEPVKSIPDNYYTINGIKYKVLSDIGNIKAGQWIDIVNWQKQKNKSINDFLSIIMLPVGEEYSIDVYSRNQKELYCNMKIVDALNISNFFLILYESIIKGLERYLTYKMKKALKLMTKEQMEMEITRKMEALMDQYKTSIQNGGLK